MQRLLFPAMTGVSLIAMATALQAQNTTISQTPGSVVLEPITLVSDGQESAEATGGVTLNQADLEALQPSDVSQLFSRDSAVNVAAGTGPSKRIYVLGLEQSNLAVTVDGVPQFKDSWHHGGSSFVDPAFLKRVEVDAGAAGADAGFAAAAGAVRYETVGARDLLTDGRTQGGRASVSYGSNGRGLTASLAGYGVYEGFDWFAMANSAKGKNYKDGAGNEIPGSKNANYTGMAKLGYEFEGHRVELAYQHSEDDADRATRMNMNVSDRLVPLKLTRDTLSLKYTEVTPTEMWDPEVSVYLSRQRYERADQAVGLKGAEFSFEARTVGGVAQNSFQVGAGTVSAGLDWAHNEYSVDNLDETNPITHNLETMQAGAFVQGRFEFANGVRLSTGARVDTHSFTDWKGQRRSDTGASVNATIAYEFAPGYEVFAGASQTWLGYDLGEYGYLHARAADVMVADGFKPAESKNYKLGVNASQGNWTGNITLFDTRMDGLANAYYPKLDNTEEYRSKGVTVSGNYSWGSGRMGASITKADVFQDGKQLPPDGGEVAPFGTVATLFIDQDIPQYNLAVGASLQLADRLSGDHLTSAGFADAPGYGVVNAYAEWSPAQYKDVVVRLGVENLLDKAYYERSTYGRSIKRNVTPLYAPGRTISLGLRMDF